MEITTSEVNYSSLSYVDIGRVFWWKGRLFRGILPEYIADVEELFNSGLISALTEKNLFVKSWITPIKMEGFGLIIEHEVISVPSYPREWTFSMLKDAAILILDVNLIALQFGYQTKDCHSYNVLFKNTSPIFVDLGSFTKIQTTDNALLSYHEFMRSYYYPLVIWKKGGSYWGQRSTDRATSLISASAYLKFCYPILRAVKNSTIDKIILVIHKIWTIHHLNQKKLATHLPSWLILTIKNIVQICGVAKIHKLKNKVNKLSISPEVTMWSNYHDELNQSGNLESTPRFDYITEKIKSFCINSVIEFGGNQGVLSGLLDERCELATIICTDIDSYALDKGYNRAKKNNIKINWAVFNPLSFEDNCLEINSHKRFCVEAVIALALTHHLILTQGFRLDHILDVFGSFTKKYIFIEFMPLGLYDGNSSPPIPTWYNENFFETEFIKKFELIESVKLEENRVLFIGQKK